MNAPALLRPTLTLLFAVAQAGTAGAASLTVDAISNTAGSAGADHPVLNLQHYDGSTQTLSSSQTTYGSSADGWVTAAPGLVSSVANAHAVNAFTHGYTGGGTLRGSGGQDNHVSLIDQLVVGSATLALGTPVDLSFNLGYTGVTSYLQSPDPISGPSMWIGATAVMALNASSTQGAAPLALSLLTNTGLPLGASADSRSGVMHTRVGDMINLQQSVDLQAGATYFDSEERTVSADFSHTFRFFADTTTSGVTLTSQTGHNYSVSAVPEPRSMLLLLAGLGGLGLLRRRTPR